MNKQKLDKWAELLLDTGKRNNLINFHETKAASADVLKPDFAALFDKAANAATLEVYQPAATAADDGTRTRVAAQTTELTAEQYVERYGAKLKKSNQILVYGGEASPVAALKNIGKRARIAIEETGVNIAYMAFGFINWTEHNGTTTFRAPVLLAPISVENSSPLEPIYIKITDDIILNPTFAFKLQSEYNVRLPDYNDDGMSYFKKVAAIVRKLGWTVSTECKIGVFSFLKINMYRDIKDNGDTIVNNVNVRALSGDPVDFDGTKPDVAKTQPDDGDDTADPFVDELHNVVDADASQAKAVRYARDGRSFVLQGPPGTGKSQTITNIIAECLYSGKKVLFVAEKLAALNVVFDKLKDAGLSEFCLQLHSHKANKKDVIEELCATLRLGKSSLSSRAADETATLHSAQTQLDEYDSELHKIRPVIGKTLYELLETVSSYRNTPDFHYVIADIPQKGASYVNEVTECLAQFTEYQPTIGYDYRTNVWYGYKNLDASYQKAVSARTQLKALKQLCLLLCKLSAQLDATYGFTVPSVAAAQKYRAFFKAAGRSRVLTPGLLNATSLAEVTELAATMQQSAEQVLQSRHTLDETYDDGIYALDGAALNKQLTTDFATAWKRMSGAYRKLFRSIRRTCKPGKSIRYADAVKATELLSVYQRQTAIFRNAEAQLDNRIGCYDGLNTDWNAVTTELAAAKEYIPGTDFGTLAKMTNEVFAARKDTFNTLAGWLDAAFSDEAELGKLINDYDKTEFDITGVALAKTYDKANACLAATDQLDNWCRFCRLTNRLAELSAMDFVNKALDEHLPLNQLDKVYAKLFFTQWVDEILHVTPSLTELSRIPHDKLVETFAEKDRLQFEINKAAIKATLSETRPDLEMISARSQVSVLLREGEKKRKQKGIRQLLADTWQLTQTLKPCFLMSPLSVSTFLGPDMNFDVVIFDEASQIFPQDAVGAIYRGKQLIVVGDGQQMPPSNFFSSIAEGEDGEDDDDITDFESILDLCSTALPQLRLKWHYRSRFEQLIAFSNKNYYDNDLVTFPASQKLRKGFGVDYYFVPGTFDRTTRTNRAEAEYIVDLVFDNFKRFPERSLGVVTFSVSQQELVDRLIAKRRRTDSSCEEFFRTDRAEPFFVKNLETVQGDERDTVIIDVAYGKDQQGKLLLNFGPLNRVGGERRLNVAVTRAKYNVQVVSGLHATDIDLTKTQSVGARLLRDYLDYAEHGTQVLERSRYGANPFEHFECDLETEIVEFLRSNGYDADMHVGCSSFRIDIAVKPQRAANYVLAVECDGNTYHMSKATRDRDRLRRDILRRMGWSFYRVWSTDWFRNKKIEQERLLAAVNEAANRAKTNMTASTTAVQGHEAFETKVEKGQFEFPHYVYADIDSLRARYPDDFLEFLRAVLQIEAPVPEDMLIKQVVKVLGKEKVTKGVIEDWNARLKGCTKYGITRKKDFVYLKDMTEYRLRAPAEGEKQRNVNDIATEELAAGILELVRYYVTVDKTPLFNAIARHLGYSRAGETMTARLNEALKTVRKYITVDGDTFTAK